MKPTTYPSTVGLYLPLFCAALLLLRTAAFGVPDDPEIPERQYDATRPVNNPYGLPEGTRVNPSRYLHSRWGTLMDTGDIALFTGARLSFSPLTRPDFSDNNKDLFLSRSTMGPSPITFIDGAPLPAFSQGARWQNPDYDEDHHPIDGTLSFPSTATNLFFPFRVSLFRYHHFPLGLRDAVTHRKITTAARKLVILVHGWNPDSSADPFAGSGNPFVALEANIKARFSESPSDWQLVKYNWAEDADTGPIFHPQVADHASLAAENAFQHGQNLGELLSGPSQHEALCPHLEKVHFIVHSAGLWVAEEAAQYLARHSKAAIHITVLDGFVPSRLGRGSALSESMVDVLSLLGGFGDASLYLLENYWSVDIVQPNGTVEFWNWLGSDFPRSATSGTFDWPGPHIQQKIDWGGNYYGHTGPISFYADTVAGAALAPSGGDYGSLGWVNSMFEQEPVFYVQPASVSVAPTGSATLSGSANTRHAHRNGTSKGMTYQWYKNGTLIPGKTSSELEFASVSDADDGLYKVVATNGLLSTSSHTVKLAVVEPTVALSSPDDGQVVSGIVSIAGTAAGASSVQVSIDDVVLAQVDGSTFSVEWDTAQEQEGIHSIHVVAYSDDGNYLAASAEISVHVSHTVPVADVDSFEPNDSSPQAAGPLVAGDTIEARISDPADVDWFQVVLAHPEQIVFDLEVPPGADFDLEVYGPDGLYIAGSYQGRSAHESLLINAVSPGVYLVRIYGYPIGRGSFDPMNSYQLSYSPPASSLEFVSAPANASVPAGADAVFRVEISGASNPKFQWLRDGIPLPGAVSSRLLVEEVGLANSGQQYSVTVTDGARVVTSQIATLSVSPGSSIVWVGGVSSDWLEAANWSPARIPGATDMVTIAGGTVDLPEEAVFGILNIESGTVHSDHTAGATVRFKGGEVIGYLAIGRSGSLKISGSATKRFGAGSFQNFGFVRWINASDLILDSSFFDNEGEFITDTNGGSNSGRLVSHEFFHVDGGKVMIPSFDASTLFVQRGELHVAGSLTISGETNEHYLFVQDGQVVIDGDVLDRGTKAAYFANGAISIGGDLRAGGEVNRLFFDYAGVNIQGDLILEDVPGNPDEAMFQVGGSVFVAGDVVNDFARDITFVGGTFTVGGQFQNSGDVRIIFGQLSCGDRYIQTAGSTQIERPADRYGILSTENGVFLEGGTLSGQGLICGPVYNRGLFAPGEGFRIDGHLVQMSTGILALQLTSETGLIVAGDASLNGILQIANFPGVTAGAGFVYRVLDVSNLDGGFQRISVQGLEEDVIATPAVSDGLLTITAANSPFALWKSEKFGSNAGDPGIALGNADPDCDGIVNLLEYAFDLSPTEFDPSGLPAVAITFDSARGLHFMDVTFVRRTNDPKVIFGASISNDSTTWDDSGEGLHEILAVPGLDGVSERVTLRCTTPVESLGAMYFKASVQYAP